MMRPLRNWMFGAMIILTGFSGSVFASIGTEYTQAFPEDDQVSVEASESITTSNELDSAAGDAVQNKAFANLQIVGDIAYIKAGFLHPDNLLEDVKIEWRLFAWNAGSGDLVTLSEFNYQIGTTHVEVNTTFELPLEVYDYYLLDSKNKIKSAEGGFEQLFTAESRWSRIAPYNGIWERTGEVTSTSAVLQTYLTEKPAFNATEDTNLRVPPMAGFAQFSVYHDTALQDKVAESGFYPVDDYIQVGAEWRRTNYNFRWTVTGLEPDTTYFYIVQTKSSDGLETFTPTNVNSFRTSPTGQANQPVTFVVAHCLDVNNTAYADPIESAERGLKTFSSMLTYDATVPDFIIMQGDTVYYDGGSGYSPDVGAHTTASISWRWLYWYAQYQFTNLMQFFQQVPGYWSVDDHDYWINNINQPMPDGWLIFRNVNPTPGGYGTNGEDAVNYYTDNPYGTSAGNGEKYWRSVRWGQHLEIFIEEGRDLRDYPAGLIWGIEQREWLEQHILASDATFKIIAATTPILGPIVPDDTYDLVTPDKHASDYFRTETELFLNNIREVKNVFILAGDRHYKYHSIVNTENFPEFINVQEFGSGSAAAPPHAIKGGVPDSDLATTIYSDGLNGPGDSAGYMRIEVLPLTDGAQITFKLIRVTKELDNDVVYQYTKTVNFNELDNTHIYLPVILRSE